MTTTGTKAPSIDEYLHRRLMPVEGAIPRLSGIEMYGNSIPVEIVGGDLFEYINFEQRYNIDARIATAYRLAEEYRKPLPEGAAPRNDVDAHVQWLKSRMGYQQDDEAQYRRAKSSEQFRIAENLEELYTTAGVLLVDAPGHGVIAAKIASTVHDTFHAFMLSELDQKGKTSTELLEKLNIRLAQSVTARNALGRRTDSTGREIATMLYGEVRPHGYFRFVNFGHPPPLVFSAEFGRFMEIPSEGLVQFPALGLQIPEDHPDRSKYVSAALRTSRISQADVANITLMGKGDILFLFTDGVYDGVDEQERIQLEHIVQGKQNTSAHAISNAILEYAVERDRQLLRADPSYQVDDKTVFIIKRT